MEELNLKPYNGMKDSSILNEAKNSLKEDEAVYSYIRDKLHLTNGQVDENLAVLLDFQEDFHYCEHCPGFEECDKNEPHYVMKLDFDGKLVVRQFEACPVYRKRQEYFSKFLRHDFSDEWNESGIQSIDRSADRKDVIRVFMKIYKGQADRWVYLTGGKGKSYLLACLANDFAKIKGPIAYCDTSLLIERLKELSFSKIRDAKERLAKMLDSYGSCPLLILDGFGNEFKSDYVFSSLLYPILSARRSNNVPTCFASDFTIDEVIGEYKGKIGALRAKQFEKLLKEQTKGEIVLSSLGIY